ncbi:hypothetical protein BUPH_08351 (plasmid) [Paraburkholderia phenoliruptrix BR3459a]|uniref:Uncharacterized protein n=1 Tax=Paraburkholderia phenoliruptrix BR3459a TaxID=1229205 RepID=K0E2W0_9BURK|nr:hypothetical protein BUPH_08351 [Paraburkholderia phenoliruptrix BR3459a]
MTKNAKVLTEKINKTGNECLWTAFARQWHFPLSSKSCRFWSRTSFALQQIYYSPHCESADIIPSLPHRNDPSP